jgi:hypothetical protein
MAQFAVGEVFVLGAGFSKAIHESMPVMPNLLEPLNDFLGRSRGLSSARYPRLQNVELFLSALAVDQPFLDVPSNLRNRALFHEVAGWLSRHLFDCQQRALSIEMPDWLAALVTTWHQRRCTIITLNYDTLIESTITALDLRDPDSRPVRAEHSYVLPIRFAASALSGRPALFGRGSTFKLCKLHGSLTWFHANAGEPPVDLEVWEDTFNSGQRAEWDEILQRALGFGDPMIIPPTLVKSEYFDNAWIRGNWQAAHAALQEASTVIVMGYSLPAGDTQTSALLGVAAQEDHYKQFVVVDVSPQGVRARLAEAALPRSGLIRPFKYATKNPIKEFAEAWTADPMFLYESPPKE